MLTRMSDLAFPQSSSDWNINLSLGYTVKAGPLVASKWYFILEKKKERNRSAECISRDWVCGELAFQEVRPVEE